MIYLIKSISFYYFIIIKLFMSLQQLNVAQNDSPADTGVGINRKNRLQPIQIKHQRLKSQQSQIGSTIGRTLKPLKKIPKGYQIASYPKAVQYMHSMSYTRKFIDSHGQEDYQPYESCVDTNQLKQYGLGIYLYLQFVKRLAITLLIMSCINMIPIIYAYTSGNALQSYSQSYMITMAKTTLGNISEGGQTEYLYFTVCDILSMIVFFGFYLHWRSFHNSAVQQQQKDFNIINPSSYAVSVVGFNPQTNNLQQNLKIYIDNMFKGCYQVEVVYNYNGNFKKFIQYDQLIQQAEKQKQVVYQTGKSNEDLLQIEQKLSSCQQQISHISQAFEPQYAIIHFRTLKAKNAFINHCRRFALVNKFSYSIKRCCTTPPSQRNLFMGKDALLVQSANLSRPQQINWDNLDIPFCTKTVRVALSVIFLIISIVITSSLIALCTLYVSSKSSCANYDPSTLLSAAQAQGGQKLYCYCAENFSQMYTDPQIEEACQDLSNTILFSNLVQAAASIVSSISNIILIYVVSFIARSLLKPESKPKQFVFIFVSVLISNFINSTVLPLVMNGDIFGFQSLEYLKFLDFIDFSKVAIFKDFDTDWYAVVSPYYMTFLIIASFSPLINLFVYYISNCFMHWSVRRACQKNDKQNPVIQKQANSWITGLFFDLPTQQALICLYMLITVMYSSFIPLLLPITTIGMIITFLCKKQVIIRYSVRVPANQYLSQKTMNLIPFIIIIHFIMGVWSHTAEGVFDSGAYVVQLPQRYFGGEIGRTWDDVPMLAGAALIIVWIIFDYTMISFCNCLHEICIKDDLQLPVQFAAIENINYADRIKKVNISPSYKLINHPIFGHALKAYKELKHRLGKKLKKMNQQSPVKDSLNPQM